MDKTIIKDIKWKTTGVMADKVNIKLYWAGKPYKSWEEGNIVTGTGNWWYWAKGVPNSGVWGLTTAAGAPRDCTGPFKIRVETASGQEVYGESGAFSMYKKTSLTLTSPTGEAPWEQGKDYTIKWSVEGNHCGGYDIGLYTKPKKETGTGDGPFMATLTLWLAKNYEPSNYKTKGNVNSFAYTVPHTMIPGTYILEITSRDTPLLSDKKQ